MTHWIITAALVTIAYWLGFRQGEAHFDRKASRILNTIGFKLGVPKGDPFWERPQEWEQALRDVKIGLEKQIRDED